MKAGSIIAVCSPPPNLCTCLLGNKRLISFSNFLSRALLVLELVIQNGLHHDFCITKDMQKKEVFLAPFQAPTLKLLYMDKGAEERKRKKGAKVQNSRKSRPCCAKLLQLFLFLLAVSFGFIFSATAVHMSRKAHSMTELHRGGGGRQTREEEEGRGG